MIFKPKKILDTVSKKYYARFTTLTGNIIVVRITEETIEKLPECRGEIIYSKHEPRKVGMLWQDKKHNMGGNKFEFSKKGFPSPESVEIPYKNLVSIPPIGYQK